MDKAKQIIRRFGWKLPYAVLWYASRAIRQNFWLFYFRTVGKYGFSKIGKGVRIDGLPSFINPCNSIELQNGVRIGKRCVFQGSENAKIIISDHVTMNDGCFVTALYGITIGKGTSIGEYTSIRDYNHEFRNPGQEIKSQEYFGASINIGEDVWIGRGCAILAGVEIGDGAIIGANAVVTKSIPANSIAVGSPARVISERPN